jgi:hypothetical protein
MKLNKRRDKQVAVQAASLTPGEYWTVERVIIGQGFAAVLDLATSTPTIKQMAAKKRPQVLAIGDGDPWAAYDPKRMGQAPNLLSPRALQRPPLHFIHPQTNPESERYLSSEAFALAVNWNKAKLDMRTLRGTVRKITPVEALNQSLPPEIRGYQLTVTTEAVGSNVHVFAEQVDVASGPGPPRQLSEQKLSDEERRMLRRPVSRGGHAYRRLLYAAEPFQSGTKLPPLGSRILIWGGSATSAWVWERYHQQKQVQGGPDGGPDEPTRPYEMWWAARPPSPPATDAWAAIRIGPRNENILEHSEKYRSVVPLADVTPATENGHPGVKVEFDGDGPEISTFDQIVVAIGREPTQPGGAIDLLEDVADAEGMETIIRPSIGPGPNLPGFDGRERAIGARTPQNDDEDATWVRAIGAAGSKVGKSHLVSKSEAHHFGDVQGQWLGQLPAEAKVPPGITAAGETIPLANGGLDRNSESFKFNLNVDTRYDLYLGFKRLLGDEKQAMKIANDVVAYRTPKRNRDEPRYRGFASIYDLKDLSEEAKEAFDRLLPRIRV